MRVSGRAFSASRCAALAAGLFLAAPVFAQMEFSGEWTPVLDEDNAGNPYTGEFVGIPMSRAGLLRAQTWNASLYTLPEWQCLSLIHISEPTRPY